ncbi:MAG: quinone oxidoreductase, partial [Pseudomonadota bacterium]
TKSLTVSRPILFHYLRDQQQYRAMASQALDKFASGQLIAPVPTPIPLAQASKAHDILESMTGGGSLILAP